jgi:predicted phosphate transport protein (TIGR00153 family)
MVLARFLPRDQQFFGYFAEAADNALATIKKLGEVMQFGPDTERNVRQLHDLEHHGDDITHRIYQALNSTFVTPLDREDIKALAGAIDDFVDDLEEVGSRVWLYRIGAPSDDAMRFVTILTDQAQAIVNGLPNLERLNKGTKELRECMLQLHRLENEGDDVLNHALATLYDGATEIPALIQALRWGELYTSLEGATDRGEDVANILEGILLKYA